MKEVHSHGRYGHYFSKRLCFLLVGGIKLHIQWRYQSPKKTQIKLKKQRQQNNNKNIFFSCKIIKIPILLHTAAIVKPKAHLSQTVTDTICCSTWFSSMTSCTAESELSTSRFHLCWPIEFSPADSWTAGLHSVWPLVFSDWPCAVQALTPGEIQSLGWIPLHPSNRDLARPNKSHLSELNSGNRNREYRTWLAFQELVYIKYPNWHRGENNYLIAWFRLTICPDRWH